MTNGTWYSDHQNTNGEIFSPVNEQRRCRCSHVTRIIEIQVEQRTQACVKQRQHGHSRGTQTTQINMELGQNAVTNGTWYSDHQNTNGEMFSPVNEQRRCRCSHVTQIIKIQVEQRTQACVKQRQHGHSRGTQTTQINMEHRI